MSKIAALCLLVLSASICAFSQTQPVSPPEWVNFSPAGEEFSIEAPGAFSFPSGSGQNGRTYRLKQNGTYYYIFSDALKDPFYYNFVRAFADGSKASASDLTVGDLTAQKFVFDDADDFRHAVVFFKTATRAYVFQTISPLRIDPDGDRFFNGLALKSLSPPETKISDEPPSTAEKTELTIAGRGGSGSGTGNGTESGSGVSPRPAAPAPSENAKETRALRILTKPRASYTDPARFYQISGKVVLKLTFLENGLIGGVTPVTKLPLGLTEQSVLAARAIQFEPAMRNGVAYPVTKTIEYTFTIY